MTLIYYIFFYLLQNSIIIFIIGRKIKRLKFIAREGIIKKLFWNYKYKKYKFSCMFYYLLFWNFIPHFLLTFAYNILIISLYHHSQNTSYIIFDSISTYILEFSHYVRVVPKCKGNILCIREAYLWRHLRENFKKIFFLYNFLFVCLYE